MVSKHQALRVTEGEAIRYGEVVFFQDKGQVCLQQLDVTEGVDGEARVAYFKGASAVGQCLIH